MKDKQANRGASLLKKSLFIIICDIEFWTNQSLSIFGEFVKNCRCKMQNIVENFKISNSYVKTNRSLLNIFITTMQCTNNELELCRLAKFCTRHRCAGRRRVKWGSLSRGGVPLPCRAGRTPTAGPPRTRWCRTPGPGRGWRCPGRPFGILLSIWFLKS